MRILLDECMPARLRRALPGHDVHTVQGLGWAGTKNGALLRRAADHGFAVLLTVDRNIEYQQNVPGLGIAIVAIRARSNDIVDLEPVMPLVAQLLPDLVAGQVIRVPS